MTLTEMLTTHDGLVADNLTKAELIDICLFVGLSPHGKRADLWIKLANVDLADVEIRVRDRIRPVTLAQAQRIAGLTNAEARRFLGNFLPIVAWRYDNVVRQHRFPGAIPMVDRWAAHAISPVTLAACRERHAAKMAINRHAGAVKAGRTLRQRLHETPPVWIERMTITWPGDRPTTVEDAAPMMAMLRLGALDEPAGDVGPAVLNTEYAMAKYAFTKRERLALGARINGHQHVAIRWEVVTGQLSWRLALTTDGTALLAPVTTRKVPPIKKDDVDTDGPLWKEIHTLTRVLGDKMFRRPKRDEDLVAWTERSLRRMATYLDLHGGDHMNYGERRWFEYTLRWMGRPFD